MTIRLFLLTLLTHIVHALCAHGSGEVLRLILDHFVPGLPPLACVFAGLVLGVTITELVTVLWYQHVT